jgi:glycogen debranching enzyme
VADTRLVSGFELGLSGTAPTLLNSSAVQPFSCRFEFVNAVIESDDDIIEGSSVHLRLDRTIGHGVHDDYDLTNYAPGPIRLDLEIRIEGDYADLFDVKQSHLVRRGEIESTWDAQAGRLTTMHTNEGFRRGLCLQAARHDSAPQFANGTISFPVVLGPFGHWHTCLLWTPILDDRTPTRPARACHALLGGDTETDRQRREWARRVTRIHTSNPAVDAVVARAVHDLAAMRIHRHDGDAAAAGGDDIESWVPGAGIPWFVTLFGRDTMIVSLQTMALSPRLATSALQALAALQGDSYDDDRDMQPGKIEHELRHGELAYLGLIPQTPYYGTHDATTLFVWAAGELWRWTADRSTLERLRPHVERALSWIDTDGDADGDGLQEYQTRAGRHGYYNQGWKDSGQAIVTADGTVAELPLALCELQGYVVAAKRAWATVLVEAFDDSAGARRLRDEAAALAAAVEERFWWDEQGTYYLGLDGRKQPIESVASNAGHLLWAGAVIPERAETVVRRLMADDMWTGWGIRTLSARHRSYNPFSYQLGSVWPHDNAILAAGFRRYGHDEPAWRVARALLDAAARFQSDRLPEVFAGLERDPGGFPAQYLGANVPQAWASGAVIHLVSMLLGVEPDAAHRTLRINPTLPGWLSELHLEGLRIGDARIDLHITRAGVEQVGADEIKVIQRPTPPT